MQLYFDPGQVHFYSESSCIIFFYFIMDQPWARQPTVPAKWKCSTAGSGLLKMEHEMLSDKVLTIPPVCKQHAAAWSRIVQLWEPALNLVLQLASLLSL